ncbi:hypothetical protein GCM10009087_04560 [Sphingomonas oligophenolica]|uniref:DUF3617 family protein n=1 Tax=Sphingomonas oligophenolica TaxID=301154 RepID=A0ABU9Y611_9SPHN
MIVTFIAGAIALTAVGPAAAQAAATPPAPVPTQTPAPTASTPATHAPVPALPGAPAAPKPEAPAEVSRNAPINGVLTLFGNERCPTDSNGNEVVVCVRRSASEQFRIPKEMREFKVTPANESWAARAQGIVGDPTVAGGIGSCSTVGPGGSTGCFLKQAQAAKAENKEKKAEQQHVEDSLP